MVPLPRCAGEEIGTGSHSPSSNCNATEALELERRGDVAGALAAWEAALAAAPDDGDALAGLARLAGRADLHAVAAALWERLAALEPGRLEAVDGRARALRELCHYAEAVEVLRAAILDHPGEARLWNTLGTVLNQQGDSPAALTFFDEAVRLDAGFAAALHNRGGVRFDLGELAGARADFAAARGLKPRPEQGAMIDFAQATLTLCCGDLGAGWDAYEARLSPDWPDAIAFDLPGARWTPQTELEGARLLVMAEQGVGDEIMFANLLPDVIAALGPTGRLSLAVEPRLTALFRRSFPSADVGAYAATRDGGRVRRSAPHMAKQPVDLWAPMGSLPRRFRRTLEAFGDRPAYLAPDPARVAHWRAWLQGQRPAVGLSWRSAKLSGERRRQYPPLAAWAPVVRTPGVRLINLQYGAGDEELEALASLAGAPVVRPPGLDIRENLDDLAALCVALDAVISVPNATAALAGACGAPVWFVTAPAAWPRLGTEAYPWYPAARSFAAKGFEAWGPVMAAVAAALGSIRQSGWS